MHTCTFDSEKSTAPCMMSCHAIMHMRSCSPLQEAVVSQQASPSPTTQNTFACGQQEETASSGTGAHEQPFDKG